MTYFFAESDTESAMLAVESASEIRLCHEGGPWTRRSRGYQSKEELIEKEGILKDPCRICGRLARTNYIEPTKTRLIERNLCFTCDFWSQKVEIKDDSRVARVNGHHHVIGLENDSPHGFRGSAGRKFRIRFHDGREIITTNLWHQGIVPAHFREQLPDNAEFIREEIAG